MTEKEKVLWAAERRNMENLFTGVTGNCTRVLNVEPVNANALGYTSSLRTIHLAYKHPTMNGLTPAYCSVFRLGVFAHEMLHQVLTDFSLLEKEILKYKADERRILQLIFNLTEDAAIEHFAPQVFGGDLLDALHFTIKHIYKQSEELERQKTPFGQYVSALIQFGDLGIYKGHFTFPESKAIFAQTAGLFSNTIEEPDSQKRMTYSKEIMEISKPLWDKEVGFENIIEDLARRLRNENEDPKVNSGKPSMIPKSFCDEDDPLRKRRRITIGRVSKEKIEDLENKDRIDEGESPEEGDSQTNEEEYKNGFDHYKIPEDTLKSINEEIDKCVKELNDEKEKSDTEETAIDKFPISSLKFGHATCDNKKVIINPELYENLIAQYQKLSSSFSSGVNSLTAQLKRIFLNDMEEKEHHTSGKVNIKRVYGSSVTCRVFDKRRAPVNKENLIVEVLVDQSGSMDGSKIEAAKNACIALAEVFEKLNVLVYVLGFTADEGTSATHFHYLTWKNTLSERLKLLNIVARNNNFDGYSIRYAGEILKKKQAQHKLLIVISDGQPACQVYAECYNTTEIKKTGHDTGINDTKDAIRDVKKFASVLGVYIEKFGVEEIQYMYGKDFLHIQNVNDLFSGIARKMKEIVEKWD